LAEDSGGKIDSLVHSINGTFFGHSIYPTIEQKVVAHLFFIINNHAFTDGNKRTACLIFEILCELNELTPNFHGFELDTWAVFLEAIKDKDHQAVIKRVSRYLFEINGN
jgi:prophage maintenance system killer protein